MVDVLLQIHAGMIEGGVAIPKIKAPVPAFRGVRACGFAPDMRSESISPGEAAAKERGISKAFLDEPYYFCGSSLTAETVKSEALMEIPTTRASELNLIRNPY